MTIDGRVATITLDRPEALNALTQPAFVAWDSALRAAARDSGIGAVVVTGAGGNFCAGQDLKELSSLEPAQLPFHPFHAFIENLAFHPKPILMAVEGVAVGAGVTVLPYADIVVIARGARLRTPFVALGATAEAGSSAALVATVGPRMAARMLLLGDWVSDELALESGLATELVDEGCALPRTLELARHIASSPPASVLATKRLLAEARREATTSALARERELLHALYGSDDNRAAVEQFNAGRRTGEPAPTSTK